MWTRFIWLWIVTSVGLFEHGEEPSDSIKGEKFVDLLSDCFLPEKVSAS
jgi:hypothetical protein